MDRPKFLLYLLGILVVSAGNARAGSTTLTSYYPSPTGYYNQLFAANVGIGTTVPPSDALDISSTSPAGNAPTVTVENTSGVITGTFGPGIVLDSHIAGQTPFIMTQMQDAGSNFAVAKYESPLTYTQYLSINQQGYVGIGSSSPSALLGIFGTAKTPSLTSSTGIVEIDSNATQALTIGADDVAPFSMWFQTKRGDNDGTSWPITLNPVGGNVGIGTYYTGFPSAVLEVNGQTLVDNGLTTQGNASYPPSHFGGNPYTNYGTGILPLTPTTYTSPEIIANGDDHTGGGIAISDDGGFFDWNDGWITYQGSKGFKVAGSTGPPSQGLLYVQGNEGIGTSVPVQQLQLTENELLPTAVSNTNGNLFFGGDTSVGNVGMRLFTFGGNGFIDTLPSAATGGLLFRVDTSNGGTERMRITAGGNVGIGVTTPAALLDVESTGGAPFVKMMSSTTTANNWITIGTGATSTSYMNLGVGNPTGTTPYPYIWSADGNFFIGPDGSPYLSVYSGNVTISGNLTVDGNITSDLNIYADSGCVTTGTSTGCASDKRLKKNIQPLSNTLSKLDQLRGVSFEWNHLAASVGNKEGQKSIGMVAQELQKVYPELVSTDKRPQHYLSIDYAKFTAVLLQSIKELKAQTDVMQDQINALQDKVKTLEKQK